MIEKSEKKGTLIQNQLSHHGCLHACGHMQFPGMRPVSKGDRTTHGGQVKPGLDSYLIGQAPLVRLGDIVLCPKCGPSVVIEGHSSWTVSGRKVALHGHLTSCGATLIASLPA